MVFPYMIIFIIGYNINKCSKKIILNCSLFCFFVYALYAICYYVTTGEYQNTQIAKNPPMLYYTSYAMAVTFLLYAYRKKIQNVFKVLKIYNVACYLGSHTIWIYFWHILFLDISFKISDYCFVRFFIVYILAVLVSLIQVKTVNALTKKYGENSRLSRNLKLIFIG